MTGDRLSILKFSTADTLGGSARSAFRIHSELRKRGHRSRMIVGYRMSDDPDIQTAAIRPELQLLNRLADKIGSFLGYQYYFVPSSFYTARHNWLKNVDVIQLYNTHGGYFAQGLLPTLARRAPLVWRLSDLWPMTGHCAYPGKCTGWMSGCIKCPDLQSYPGIGFDRTQKLFLRKQRLYSKLSMTVVATSSWTEKHAQSSPLLSQFPVVRIPNGLDAKVFRPKDINRARERLAIPKDAIVILFNAHILDHNPRKGDEFLKIALQRIGRRDNVILALLGKGGDSFNGHVPLPIHHFGFQTEDEKLSDCYAAADVVVIPSVQENLPNTLIEALGCGRTVIAFNSGGMRDGVIHGETGYLAREEDADDLANGLLVLLNNKALRNQMSRRSRELFEAEFTCERETDRFEKLYRGLHANAISAN